MTSSRTPVIAASRPRSSSIFLKESPFSASTVNRRGGSCVKRRLTPLEKATAELAEALQQVAQLQAESRNKTDFILAQKEAAIVKTTELEDMAAEALDQLALRTIDLTELKHATKEYKAEKESHILLLTADLQKANKTLESKNEIIRGVEGSLNAATTNIGRLEAQVGELEASEVYCMDEISSLRSRAELSSQLLCENELERRQLHNKIQELKGNIRVFCRVRAPPDAGSRIPGHLAIVANGDQQEIALKTHTNSVSGESKTKVANFSFDRVFSGNAKQSQIFAEISQLMQSALDGYNVTVFAYGQTGSGKTYTMEGVAGDVGLIPRAVSQLFESAVPLEAKGWTYTYEASFLEIYNENIRDLLSEDPTQDKKHTIILGSAKDEVTVSGLTLVPVKTPKAVAALLATATSNRAVGATVMNAKSSRSHSIFRLKISGHNDSTANRSMAMVNLVDLAGSERLGKSGVEGDRLKEMQSINKSLSNLGTVISALSKKEKHIPYRNSKLTFLLQPALGGHSKMLMFANISADPVSTAETLSSLQFASKVNNCQIGTARQSKTSASSSSAASF